jgi:hypothetical protein
VFDQTIRIAFAFLTSVFLLAAAPSESQAQTGLVQLNVFRAGFIVGVGGGEGTLTYQGGTYPFSVGGVGVGMIGAAGANLTGQAFNLQSPSDIAGTYSAVGAGAAFVGGVKVVQLRNANGVLLQLQGGEVGFELSLNLSGMTITMR